MVDYRGFGKSTGRRSQKAIKRDLQEVYNKLSANKFKSESGHWYTQEGEPMYTIVGANGKERNTTLRDAKKEGFVPSVTTIIGIAAKKIMVVPCKVKNELYSVSVKNVFSGSAS